MEIGEKKWFFDLVNFLENYSCDVKIILHSFPASEEGPACLFLGKFQASESGNLAKNIPK